MSQAAQPKPVRWTPDAIREEVRRRNLILTGIARAYDLPEDACHEAHHGMNRRGAGALAEALGIPFDTLFPKGFVQSRRKASVKTLSESRQKRGSASDTARLRA